MSQLGGIVSGATKVIQNNQSRTRHHWSQQVVDEAQIKHIPTFQSLVSKFSTNRKIQNSNTFFENNCSCKNTGCMGALCKFDKTGYKTFVCPGISGGSGEHKLYSSDGFADDESYRPIPVFHRDVEPKVCFRCKTVSDTRSRCCRKCYQTRDQWMPSRPTRKLRKREYSLVSSDEDNVYPQPPLSKYSNLRRIRKTKNAREDHSSSEDSNPWEFAEERRRQRLKRRAYVRKILEKAYEDSSASSTDVENVCLVCQIRPLEVVLVHEKVAHLCVCKKCAVALDRANEKCPACGRKIYYYFTGYPSKK